MSPRQIAAEAWPHTLEVARRFERRCSGPDYAGEVAERIVRSAGRYDRTRGSIRTWARHQARGACLDAMRANVAIGPQFRGGARKGPAVYSLDGMTERAADAAGFECGHGYDQSLLARDADRPGFEVDDALADLCRGLLPEERRVIDLVYRDGLELQEAGDRLGVSRSWASLLHKRALAHVRARLEREGVRS